MADYDKRLSGALFKNEKGDNPKKPDYKGSFTDGENKEFWVSAWVKKSAAGVSFMSLSMQAKEAKPEQAHIQKVEFDQPEESGLPF